VISIDRPASPPARLASKGPAAIAALRALFDGSPQDFLGGVKTFEFDSDIYGHKTVKDALKLAQHNKCCFCESNVTAFAHGDVEHFRPKAGYQQRRTDVLGRPGYYWLAYEWSNLLFSCQICNQAHKKNFFPLANPTRRAKSHADDVKREKALLIDPAAENPEDFIGFRQEIAFARNGNRRGKATIDIVGLNRPDLCEQRRELLVQVRLLVDLLTALREEANDSAPPVAANLAASIASIETQLRSMRQPGQAYAAMFRSALDGVISD
jgi:uncharacterized protein (TIGR02646 family)